MLNISIKSLVFLCLLSTLFPQSVSMSQIEQLSNNQIDAIKEGFKSNSVSEEQIENQLGDVPHTYADRTKAAKQLNYKPKITLKEGLLRMNKWILTLN